MASVWRYSEKNKFSSMPQCIGDSLLAVERAGGDFPMENMPNSCGHCPTPLSGDTSLAVKVTEQ